MSSPQDLQNRAINTIRFLSADAVQTANSGHPGLPMGAAAIAFTLWTRHLRFNPRNPSWPDRDRFVLSGGHGSMLLYSLLHLTGYDLGLEEIKNFRQWGSRTPGHPESHLTPGVEATTGPLGQGFGNAVGMAIAEASLAASYNRPGHTVVDHYTYAVVTDGDLMEGVASEAASLAGHLRLGRLIFCYDDNRISIDGSTELTFTEDRAARFRAYGWHTLSVPDGNDVEAIDRAIQEARGDPRPSLIVCRTHIGFGLPTRQDTADAHGEPPGVDELQAARARLGWPLEPWFYIPEDVLVFFRRAIDRGALLEADWRERVRAYAGAHAGLAQEFQRRLRGEIPLGWDDDLPLFPHSGKGMATRAASGKVLDGLGGRLPELIGGSADLTPSNKTRFSGITDFQPDNPSGRYIRFGVREHAMGAVVNGLAYHGGMIPFGGTFLVFSDYMRPAVRLSALAHLGSIWVYTHDSIGLGEDGPTHQPVEHLAALRAIPNLAVIRPADAAEVAEAWRQAILRRHAPTALVLSRQDVPTLDRGRFAPAAGLQYGAYVLADLGNDPPQVLLAASGSEVGLIVEAGEKLAAEGAGVRLVSFPCWELFEAQDQAYRDSVFPPGLEKRLGIEAGVAQGWGKWLGGRGRMISVENFGASAPYQRIFDEYGITAGRIYSEAFEMLKGPE